MTAPRRKRGKVPSQDEAQPAGGSVGPPGNPGGGERSTSPAGEPAFAWSFIADLYMISMEARVTRDGERMAWIQAGGHAFAERVASEIKARCEAVLGKPPVTSLSDRMAMTCPKHYDCMALCDCPTMADWLGEDLPERGT